VAACIRAMGLSVPLGAKRVLMSPDLAVQAIVASVKDGLDFLNTFVRVWLNFDLN